jgi:K+-transporting ATPase ATPase A chain
MSPASLTQMLVFAAVLVTAAYALGGWMARVFSPTRTPGPAERAFLRLIRADGGPQGWRAYAASLLAFSGVSVAVLLLGLLAQGHLPLNPNQFPGLPPLLALHTSASFVSSTNWQFYSGEATMSYLSQMAGLAVQNFAAPAVGLAVLVATTRALRPRPTGHLGNFWVDLYRSLAFVLLPLTVVAALLLTYQGTPQTLQATATAVTVEGDQQPIARGPVATQVAIRHLGTNGGGFYNTNAATPFENPNGLTNVFELFLQLIVPTACVFMFGRLVGSRRLAWVVIATMLALAAAGVAVAVGGELHGSQVLRSSGLSETANMADKEVRIGVAGSAFFASGTTAGSGSGVDTGHDALTAAGGAVPLVNMFTGVIGGVGAGMLSMLFKILLAVFVAGLMIGRTPQLLGKKIGALEMKLVAVGLLAVPVIVLAATGLSIATSTGRESIFNPGPHGFTETLYAFTSQANNNGSAFAGFGYTDFQAVLGTGVMLAGRLVPLMAMLALAGALAGKRAVPVSRGTLRLDTPTFAVLLAGTVVITSALTLLPSLSLGPIVEALAS